MFLFLHNFVTLDHRHNIARWDTLCDSIFLENKTSVKLLNVNSFTFSGA